jgi:hypothetical protein
MRKMGHMFVLSFIYGHQLHDVDHVDVDPSFIDLTHGLARQGILCRRCEVALA